MAGIWIFLAGFIALLAFSIYRFYKENAYRVMIGFTALGFVMAYYFKGVTEAKHVTGGSIGTEGLFMGITVLLMFIISGIIGQFLSIALKKTQSKNHKIALSISGIFVILSLLSFLLRLF